MFGYLAHTQTSLNWSNIHLWAQTIHVHGKVHVINNLYMYRYMYYTETWITDFYFSSILLMYTMYTKNENVQNKIQPT